MTRHKIEKDIRIKFAASIYIGSASDASLDIEGGLFANEDLRELEENLMVLAAEREGQVPERGKAGDAELKRCLCGDIKVEQTECPGPL